MGKKKTTGLTPPTDAEALAQPDRVKRGPKGGWQWLCSYCGLPASAVSSKGARVCYRHGGASKRQTDPEVRAEAVAAGKDPPRTPGRPVEHGFYAVIPGVRVDETVARYRELGLDPDSTDDDMYYLRAYLDELRKLAPDATQVQEAMQEVLKASRTLQRQMVQDVQGKPTVEKVLEQLDRFSEFEHAVALQTEVLHLMVKVTNGTEARHANLIKLARTRADTQLKLAGARQLDVFVKISERFMTILQEQLDPNALEALQERLKRELAEVPARAWQGERLDGQARA